MVNLRSTVIMTACIYKCEDNSPGVNPLFCTTGFPGPFRGKGDDSSEITILIFPTTAPPLPGDSFWASLS